MPGHAELVARLAFDGRTSGPEAAAAILQAEAAARGNALQAHAADAPPAAPPSTPPAQEALTQDQQVERAQAYAAEHGVSFVAALKALGFAR
jgi:hypothetical protein